MRRAIVCVGLVLCSFVGLFASAATAQPFPPNRNQPAATLLLPYFEVDLENANGVSTLFSVNNASASAATAKVTIWSDLGVPVFSFDVYLTGYDVQSINLRDILVNGVVPVTADAGVDTSDTGSPTTGISNKGVLSQDINFPGAVAPCAAIPPPVPPIYLPYFASALTGGPSSFHAGRCVARNHGTPAIARGYVTVDSVTQCSIGFPSDPFYFAGGIADTRNILWGEYQIIDPSQDFSVGEPLVHIATPGFVPGEEMELQTPGNYTFYGAFNAWAALDRREPLSTTFAARYVSPKDFKTPDKARRRTRFPAATELIVWRDPKVITDPFTCGSAPPWFPLSQEQIRAFDDQEQSELPAFTTAPFPGVTQRVALANNEFPLTFQSGWLYLNLNHATADPPIDPLAAQAWVTVLQRVRVGPTGGRYDVGFRATRLDTARGTGASHVVIQ